MNKGSKKCPYIAVAGILGSGKTTAARLIAKELGFHLLEERADENIFLPLFYKNPKRWAFHAQIHYLHKKTEQLKKMRELLKNKGVVHDSPLIQDHKTYALAQQKLGNMSGAEFKLYEKMVTSLSRDIPHPDLIIHLDAPHHIIRERIKKRGRGYEKGISQKYLATLSSLQKKWIQDHGSKTKILSVDSKTLNFAENPTHQKELITKIKSALKDGLV